jgi:hypothetical protein
MAIHRIKAGVSGQVLEIYPAAYEATATWELHDLTYGDTSGTRVLASGSATVDTFDEDTSATAGPATANARRIPLEDTTGLTIDRRYEIAGVDSSEVFELAGINADSYGLARWPLGGAYASGATVRGLRLASTTAIASAVYDDDNLLDQQRQLRVVWTLASGKIVQRQAMLVRHDEADLDVDAIAAKIRNTWPDVHTRVDQHNRNVMPDLVSAAKAELRTLMLTKGKAPERYLTGEVGEWATAWRVLDNLANTGNVPANTTPERWQDFTRDRFLEFWSPLVMGTPPRETTETDPATDATIGRHSHDPLVLT